MPPSAPICRTGLESSHDTHQIKLIRKSKKEKEKKHTAAGVRWSSPTQLLICRSIAWFQRSGRDAIFSTAYGRMYQWMAKIRLYHRTFHVRHCRICGGWLLFYGRQFTNESLNSFIEEFEICKNCKNCKKLQKTAKTATYSSYTFTFKAPRESYK